ncbi:hypothetical protein [Nitrospira sp. Nam80]
MVTQSEGNEAMVLDLLRSEKCLKLEQVVTLLPELSWNQVFQCVDSLSRRGEILLLRRGFDYEIASPQSDREGTRCSV